MNGVDEERDRTRSIKKNILRMVHGSRTSHVGSCLSSFDILYTLYFKVVRYERGLDTPDTVLLSKAHASAALYAILAEKGFFPKEYLETFSRNDGRLPGHLTKDIVPGVTVSAGSLGHGLPIGLGMAMANKADGNDGIVYVVMSDGECNEGSVWEAAMLAGTRSIDNLVAVIDLNGLQAFGRTCDVIDQSNMSERWRSFGWDAEDVDGHDHLALEKAMKRRSQKPRAIIAHTVKGKGISFMEDQLCWHYKSPNDDELKKAFDELEEMR